MSGGSNGKLSHAGPGPAGAGESAARPVLPRKIVRCSACRKFITEIVVTAAKPPNGPLITLKNLMCPACKTVTNVDMGIGDHDDPNLTKKVEQRLREMNQAEAETK